MASKKATATAKRVGVKKTAATIATSRAAAKKGKASAEKADSISTDLRAKTAVEKPTAKAPTRLNFAASRGKENSGIISAIVGSLKATGEAAAKAKEAAMREATVRRGASKEAQAIAKLQEHRLRDLKIPKPKETNGTTPSKVRSLEPSKRIRSSSTNPASETKTSTSNIPGMSARATRAAKAVTAAKIRPVPGDPMDMEYDRNVKSGFTSRPMSRPYSGNLRSTHGVLPVTIFTEAVTKIIEDTTSRAFLGTSRAQNVALDVMRDELVVCFETALEKWIEEGVEAREREITVAREKRLRERNPELFIPISRQHSEAGDRRLFSWGK